FACGAPSATAVATGARPVPASLPSLLAIGLRRDYPAGCVQAVTTSAFAVDAVPPDRRATLRALEWHDLGAGDAVEATLVLTDATGATARASIGAWTGAAAAGPAALAPSELDAGPAIAAGLASLGNPTGGAEARIELRLTSAGGAGRGFFADDLELVLEP
ncbi:MAG TPA: hypothetical protein VHF22_08925, partial [Planctomycetota bacterium]|nr:hypothetical protein [Planctomycetota bacterium]